VKEAIRLSTKDAAVLMQLPKREFVLRSPTGLSDRYVADLAHVTSLRMRGLITIKLDWDRSTAANIARDLAVTPAGAVALTEYRQRGPGR
jgi:hypothetical protein